MNKKYGKFIIIFVILLAIYGLIIYFVAGGKKEEEKEPNNNGSGNTNPVTPTPDIPKSQVDAIIFISESGILTHSDIGWRVASTEVLSGKTFDVYKDNSLIGNYRIMYNDIWRLYDDNNNRYDYDNGSIMGVNTDLDFRYISIHTENVTSEDKNNVKEFLDKKDLKYDIDSISIKKHTYDFNNDGIRDDILYTASHSVDLDGSSNDNDIFSAIFVKNSNNTQQLLFSKDEGISYDIKAFFDLDDIKYVLLSGEYPSDSGYNIRLYKIDSKIELAISGDFK